MPFCSRARPPGNTGENQAAETAYTDPPDRSAMSRAALVILAGGVMRQIKYVHGMDEENYRMPGADGSDGDLD
jgi:hypothetical protein